MNLNMFLSTVKNDAPVYGLHVHLSQNFKTFWDWWPLRHHSLLVVLEASDVASVESLSPFFGAMRDRCSGEAQEAPISRIFTFYSTILYFFYRRCVWPGWTDQDRNKLEESICSIKSYSVKSWKVPAISDLYNKLTYFKAIGCRPQAACRGRVHDGKHFWKLAQTIRDWIWQNF